MTPKLRPAVRALVVDEHDHVLLVHLDGHGLDIPGGVWACPGGGIDRGETPHEALRRELGEKLGLHDVTIDAGLWTLSRELPMADWDGQTETTFLVRIEHFTPSPVVDLEAANVRGVRWFSLAEIAAGTVRFSPRDLHEQLLRLYRNGVPSSPLTIPALP